jgi:Na+-translocating ferredoxin:NAD+ oxidoreductase subunit B
MTDAYHELAECLDNLPNGFPATADGAELRLLAKLFSPDEAALAAQLTQEFESPLQIAQRNGLKTDPKELGQTLRAMARKGLISAGRAQDGVGFKLLPFVVGIYENQIGSIDVEMARLFEDYYTQSFGQALRVQPAFHRVIPIQESVRVELEIQPYESAAAIVERSEAWGVMDCICRTQKALIGQACEHPIDVCMTFGPYPGMFDHHPVIRALTRAEAHATLKRAASAGLVHSVSNSQEGIWYICNCCTCSCGILRGMSEMGIANAVARSPFVNQLDESLCITCEACLSYCQFGALELSSGHTRVNNIRCIGCGVCVPSCPEGALALVRRPEVEVQPAPVDHAEWARLRSAARKGSLE